MAQVERRAAANSAKIEQARGNALFALDVAVGRLQSEAGPDQRISARAEILDATPATTAVTGVNQPHWTGIWKTGNNTLDVGATPQRNLSFNGTANPPAPTLDQKATSAAWLVSGTTALSPLTFSGTTTGTTRDAVVLAANYGSTSANVTVPLVPMFDGNGAHGGNATGAYAYWVSDEGVKAKLNLSNPSQALSPSSNFVESQLQFTAPSAVAAHKALPAPLNVDFRANEDLPKVQKFSSLSRLSSADPTTDLMSYAADFTTEGFGVLSDVRHGGLKKDLTAAFEDDAGANPSGAMGRLMAFSDNRTQARPENRGKVYSTTNSGPLLNDYSYGYTMDGLRWMSLYNYYNLYKQNASAPTGLSVNNPSGPVGVGTPRPDPAVAVRNYTSDTQFETRGGQGANNTNRLIRDNLTARPLAWQVHIGVKSYQDAVDGRWKLKILVSPGLVLYNPYNVRLTHPPNFQYEWLNWYNPNPQLFDALQFAIGTNTGANQFNFQPLRNYSVSANGSQGDLSTRYATAANANLDFEPGEIKIFGLDRIVDPATGSDNFTKLQNFFSPDFYHAIDLKRIPVDGISMSAGGNISNNGTFIGTLNGTDSLLLRRVFPRLRSNGAQFNLNMNIPNSSPGGGTWAIWPQGAPVNRQFLGSGSLFDIPIAPLTVPIDLGRINSLIEPIKILTYTVWLKGTDSAEDLSGNGTLTARPMPVFGSSGAQLNPVTGDIRNGLVDLQVAVGNFGMDKASLNATPGSGGSVRSFWGESVTGGQTQIALKDVPRQPPVSIGQFMHMNPAYDANRSGSVARSPVLHPVGGSWASPFLPRTKSFDDSTQRVNTGPGPGQGAGVVRNTGDATGAVAGPIQVVDDAFMANDALFDSYFFSSVPSRFHDSNRNIYAPIGQTFDSTFIKDGKNLPNTRMRFFRRNGNPPSVEDLRDLDEAAANLLVDGAFNVNSTSVAAWKSLLGSLSGNRMLAGDKSEVNFGGRAPIPRLLTPVSGGSAPVNTAWGGVRALSDAELDQLAEQIVLQVKERGPFLSMSDFLNRRLVDDMPLGLYGALQAAIEATSINQDVRNSVGRPTSVSSFASNSSWYFDEDSLPPNTATGVPGYLMQQDIVQAFAPMMAVRSDTFQVRVFGEVRNPRTGEVEASAVGEAVVQRVPDLVNGTQLPESDSALIQSDPVNSAFGRKFQVVSFRWLASDEI